MKKNDVCQMTDEALDNYGQEFENVEFVVTHVAHSYMPAKQFFAMGKPEGYHPGYDEGVKGQKLYDLKRKDTEEEINFSLYDWELVKVS